MAISNAGHILRKKNWSIFIHSKSPIHFGSFGPFWFRSISDKKSNFLPPYTLQPIELVDVENIQNYPGKFCFKPTTLIIRYRHIFLYFTKDLTFDCLGNKICNANFQQRGSFSTKKKKSCVGGFLLCSKHVWDLSLNKLWPCGVTWAWFLCRMTYPTGPDLCTNNKSKIQGEYDSYNFILKRKKCKDHNFCYNLLITPLMCLQDGSISIELQVKVRTKKLTGSQ